MNATAQPAMSTPLLRLFAVFWWLVFFGSIAVAGSLVGEWRSIVVTPPAGLGLPRAAALVGSRWSM
jgi:hypothetical protein